MIQILVSYKLFPQILKKSDAVSKKINKKAKFNTLNAKVNILKNKIPDPYALNESC